MNLGKVATREWADEFLSRSLLSGWVKQASRLFGSSAEAEPCRDAHSRCSSCPIDERWEYSAVYVRAPFTFA